MSTRRAAHARPRHVRGAEELVRQHVDQMAEQILRTCHSFVIYARDFSNCALRRRGDTVMQGSQDIAVHVGTLHYTAKAVLEAFEDDIHPGDVFADQRSLPAAARTSTTSASSGPIFPEGELIALRAVQRPLGRRRRQRSRLLRHQRQGALREGLRVPPVRIWDRGATAATSSGMIVVQHARARATSGRPARPGGGDARSRAGDPAAHREVRPRHGRDGVRRGAGLRRAAHPRADRRAAGRHLGDRGLRGLSTRPARRAWSRSRSSSRSRATRSTTTSRARIRPSAASSTPRSARRSPASWPARRRSSRRSRSTPASTASSRSTSGREGTRRQRALAQRRHRILLRGLREDHERELRAVVAGDARAGDRLLFNLEYLLVGGRDARRPTTADLHVVRLDGRRLGRPQRQGRRTRRAGLRRRARRAAARGAGAALPRGHDRAPRSCPTRAAPASTAAAAASTRAGRSPRPTAR